MIRYSPTCTKLFSQYKVTPKLVEQDVPSIEQFMSLHQVGHNVTLSYARPHSYVTR